MSRPPTPHSRDTPRTQEGFGEARRGEARQGPESPSQPRAAAERRRGAAAGPGFKQVYIELLLLLLLLLLLAAHPPRCRGGIHMHRYTSPPAAPLCSRRQWLLT